MILPMLLARIVVSVLLFCLPFILFIALSGKQENAMLLIFPVFGAIPAIVGALVFFVPAEAYLSARGLGGWKNIVVPAIGFLLPVIFFLVMGTVWGKLDIVIRNTMSHGTGVFAVWGVLGALWGAAWRSTEWLAKLIGLSNG